MLAECMCIDAQELLAIERTDAAKPYLGPVRFIRRGTPEPLASHLSSLAARSRAAGERWACTPWQVLEDGLVSLPEVEWPAAADS